MGADVGQVDARIQVTSVATSRSGAKALGEQVRDAMQRKTVTHGGVTITVVSMNDMGTRWDPDDKAWKHFQDFGLWGSE